MRSCPKNFFFALRAQKKKYALHAPCPHEKKKIRKKDKKNNEKIKNTWRKKTLEKKEGEKHFFCARAQLLSFFPFSF